MHLKNRPDRFGVIAISLHWLMAILIIGLLSLGLYMTRLPVSLEKLRLYGWHKEFGVLVLGLVVLRFLWRMLNVQPSHELPRLEEFTARAVHWLLYLLMVAMPLSGWMMSSAAGVPVSFFGLFVLPNPVMADDMLRVRLQFVHLCIGYSLIALISLHILAALKHHFINRDRILRRMLPW